MNEENVMWRKVIASELGLDESGWLTQRGLRAHSKCLWKRIEDGKANFLNQVNWKMVEEIGSVSGMTKGWKRVCSKIDFPRSMLLPLTRQLVFLTVLRETKLVAEHSRWW